MRFFFFLPQFSWSFTKNGRYAVTSHQEAAMGEPQPYLAHFGGVERDLSPRRGRDTSAQGNALGRKTTKSRRPERAQHPHRVGRVCRPFRARGASWTRYPGRCPGLVCGCPFGASGRCFRSRPEPSIGPCAIPSRPPLASAVRCAPPRACSSSYYASAISCLSPRRGRPQKAQRAQRQRRLLVLFVPFWGHSVLVAAPARPGRRTTDAAFGRNRTDQNLGTGENGANGELALSLLPLFPPVQNAPRKTRNRATVVRRDRGFAAPQVSYFMPFA